MHTSWRGGNGALTRPVPPWWGGGIQLASQLDRLVVYLYVPYLYLPPPKFYCANEGCVFCGDSFRPTGQGKVRQATGEEVKLLWMYSLSPVGIPVSKGRTVERFAV